MKKSFEILYDENFEQLYYYALGFVDNSEEARDIVQESFISYYKNKGSIHGSDKSYLFSTVKNMGINLIKHKEVENKFVEYSKRLSQEYNEDFSYVANEVFEALKRLPEKSRKIFLLSCVEGLKYKEIAEDYNISVSTVKFHVSKVMKVLREDVVITPDLYASIILLSFF